jgi:WD40 repeat protein
VQDEVLLYSNHSKKLMFYDYVAKRVKNVIPMDKVADVNTLDVSQSGQHICMGTSNRMVRLVDCHSHKVEDIVAHSSAITCVRFSPDNRFLISCASSELLVWNVL